VKPGDLVQVVCNGQFRGKIGMIIGYTEEHERFHPYYRLWKVLLEGKTVTIQGMNLVKI
jgi:ribosomal protein L24